MTITEPSTPVRSWWWGALTATVLAPFVGSDRPCPPPLPVLTQRLVALVVFAWSATWFGLGINDMAQLGMVGGVPFLIALPHGAATVVAVRWPLAGWRLMAGAMGLAWLVVPEGLPAQWQVALYVVVLAAVAETYSTSGRTILAVGVLSTVGLLLLTGPTPALVSVGVPLLVGFALGTGLRARSALADQEQRAARAQARSGALTERTRIAREMHDVVAHHMSLVVVRCETAAYRLAGVGEQAAAEFTEIAAQARSAVTEMQALLGVLRADDENASRTPQPGLAELAELVATSRAAGMDVTLDRSAVAMDTVPDAVALSAYRIIQEALTNAGRHAAGAPVVVGLRRAENALELEIRNGPGGRARPNPGGGNGLVGIRERVDLHGGGVRHGPTGDGGYVVWASLPTGRGGRA